MKDNRGAVRVSQIIGSNARRELTMRDANQASCESTVGEKERRKGEGRGIIRFFSTKFTSVCKQNVLVKQRNIRAVEATRIAEASP